jgi:DNA-directed RNA polymerase specialized sigma subunit
VSSRESERLAAAVVLGAVRNADEGRRAVQVKPKRHYRHMNPRAARVIRDLYFVGRLKQHEIGRMFGLRQGSVSRIVSERVCVERLASHAAPSGM